MAWKVEFDPRALKELSGLDRVAQKRIVRYLQERVLAHSSPRGLGRALIGEKAGFWRYRIGDYRAICFLDDREQVARIMRIAHRKEAYR